MNRIEDGESAKQGLQLVADLDASGEAAKAISEQVLVLSIDYVAKVEDLSEEESTSASTRFGTSVAANAASFNAEGISQDARDVAKAYLSTLLSQIN